MGCLETNNLIVVILHISQFWFSAVIFSITA